MIRTFLACGTLVCALAPIACASEEPPPFLLSLYESGGASGDADGGVRAALPGPGTGGAASSSTGGAGVATPEPAGTRAFGQGGRPNTGGAGGSGGKAPGAAGGTAGLAAGGAVGRAGTGGVLGAGGANGGSAEDAGVRSCSTQAPETGSACSVGGLQCSYGRIVCSCTSGHWFCDD